MSMDNYPTTTTDTYDVLFCYKKTPPQRQLYAPPAAVTFVQRFDTYIKKTVPGNDGGSFAEAT